MHAIDGACTRLRQRHFCAEALRQVLHDDPIGRGKEGKDGRDKVALTVVEALPISAVGSEIDLLGGPEGRLMLLVHLPHPLVLDRKEHEPCVGGSADWLHKQIFARPFPLFARPAPVDAAVNGHSGRRR